MFSRWVEDFVYSVKFFLSQAVVYSLFVFVVFYCLCNYCFHLLDFDEVNTVIVYTILFINLYVLFIFTG